MHEDLTKKFILKSPKEDVSYYIIKKQFEFNIKNILEDLFESYFFTKYSKNLPKFFILILEYTLFDDEINNIKNKVDVIFKNKGGIYKDYNAKIFANFDEIRIISHNSHIVHYFSKRSKYSCILIQNDMKNFMKLNLLTNKTNYLLILKKNNFDEIKMIIS